MRGPAGSDVVVVGGGVIGLAVAWRAAQAGARVTVVDPRPGRGATWAAAGMLAPVGEALYGEEALSALMVRAAAAWPRFAEELTSASGTDVGYRTEGTLLVAVDPSDRAALDDLLDYRATLGLVAHRRSGAECRAAEPLLAPAIRGGAELPGDHQVDNRCLVAALVEATTRAGAVVERVRVTRLVDGGGLGVVLDDGRRLAADRVVVAAGCWSAQLEGWPEPTRPPVRPVKGLTLRLRARPTANRVRRTVRGLVHGRTCYLVPRADGGVVVGATVEERGFDLAVEAGSVGDLLDDARRLVPALEGYELCQTSTGLRPGSPDNAPMVGPVGGGGVVLATGHYRNGILLAPLTADEVVRLVAGDHVGAAPATEDPDSAFAAFRPGRFGPQGRPPDAPVAAARPAGGEPR